MKKIFIIFSLSFIFTATSLFSEGDNVLKVKKFEGLKVVKPIEKKNEPDKNDNNRTKNDINNNSKKDLGKNDSSKVEKLKGEKDSSNVIKLKGGKDRLKVKKLEGSKVGDPSKQKTSSNKKDNPKPKAKSLKADKDSLKVKKFEGGKDSLKVKKLEGLKVVKPSEKKTKSNKNNITDENKTEKDNLKKDQNGNNETKNDLKDETKKVIDKTDKKENIKKTEKDLDFTGIKKQQNRFKTKDILKKELFGLYLFNGGFIPVADFGPLYNAGYQLGLRANVTKYNFFNFHPIAQMKWSNIKSVPQTGVFNTSFDFVQITVGIMYQFRFHLPKSWQVNDFLKRKVTLYGGIYDGLTILAFDIESSSETTIEGVNVFGICAGFSYPVWDNFDIGFEVSWEILATAGVGFQSVSLGLVLGYRF